MKNRLSVIITLTIFLSGSGMAALDSILEQFAKLEIFYTNSNLEDRSSMCSHLDALIANNKAMPEAWLPQPCCEQEAKLKKTIEMIKEHDIRDYLSHFEDCGEVADKLFILKDHEYYHYILLQTIMGLKRHCSTNELDTPHHFTDKDVRELQLDEGIIQEKIKSLIIEGRYFEERPFSVRKYSSAYSIKVGSRAKELGLETLCAKYSNLCSAGKDSDNPVCTSFLVYMSKGVKRSLNGKVYRNGELVKCCHLSAWWLKLKEFEYGTIDSEENIGRCKKIPCDEELDNIFVLKGCPSEGIYFEISQLQEVIHDIAISLFEGQEKRYFVGSSVHEMGLRIKRNKYNNIIIYYYDPNDTLRHKEIIAKTVGDLKYLHYDDFWSPIDAYAYFPGQDKVCCLLSLHTKALQKDCKVVCRNKPSANLMHLLSRNGHYGHAEVVFDLRGLDRRTKKELIAGKRIDGIPALYMASQNRHLEALSTLIAMIINIDLDPDVKKELLAGRREDGTSSLFIASQFGYHEIVTVFIAGIFSGDLNLSNSEKAELFAGTNGDGCSALYEACYNGYHAVVAAIITGICRGDLNFNDDGITEFSAGENTHCFSALISVIRRGFRNLSKNPKAELLAGKNEEGCPALYIACKNGHLGVVNALVSAICSSDLSLSKSEKAELLAGKNADGGSALEIARVMGYYEIVNVLLASGVPQ